MCILKKTGGPCVKGPGTGGRASQTVAHAVEVRSKHGFGNAPRGKMPSRTGESASGDQLGRGRAVGKSCSRLPPESRIFVGQGRTCLPAGRAGPGKIKGKAKGKGRAGGRGFPVKTGASSLKKLARRPCLLRQETAGDTGSHGHPKLLPLSPSSLRARAAAVPCGCGRRAEGLLPERHRSRLPGRVPV